MNGQGDIIQTSLQLTIASITHDGDIFIISNWPL